jgi:hypothetical protein
LPLPDFAALVSALNTRQTTARDISKPGLAMDKLMRRGIDLVLAEHKANRS